MTLDIKNAFDPLDHNVLNSFFKKCKTFIIWIDILFKDQQYCIVDGGTTTQYFNFKRSVCQGNPVLAFLFRWMLENRFSLIKIKHSFLHTLKLMYLKLCPFFQAETKYNKTWNSWRRSPGRGSIDYLGYEKN